MSVLVKSSAWEVDPSADQLHEQGLDSAVYAKNYQEAHQLFNQALGELHTLPTTPDTELQAAHIIRDDGFTYFREWLAGEEAFGLSMILGRANRQLSVSLESTADLLARETADTRRSRELLSEHGATISAIGRALVASEVKLGEAKDWQSRFNEADIHLCHGSNVYYLVSNTMHSTRANRGLRDEPVPWVKRVGVDVGSRLISDRRNVLHAIATARRIRSSMDNAETAKASILARP